jgi:hypothetical protein
LSYKLDRRTDQYGNVFRYRAQVNPGDPASIGRIAYDVFFVVDQMSAKASGSACVFRPRKQPNVPMPGTLENRF